jgi:aspartyl-tRNA(Asn)/glutamyl-tRNA(Gln) amidotransferase subunit A
MTGDLWALDASALLAAFQSGAATPQAAMLAALERIEALDPDLGALSTRSTSAMEEAKAATARWRDGAPCGPLDGVPLVVKDNLVSAGLPAAWGNSALAGRVCEADELPVARLRAAGAIVVGKGNCPEFAVDGYTDNLTFGVTRNPFDPALTPGGSSGGVVAALSTGMATIGIATDGGGSIRRPAGYCGLFGLKPGIGRVARGGGLAQVLLDFEVAGPVTRSARDLVLLDSVLAGPDRHDPASRAQVCPQTVGPLRVLYVPRLGEAPCAPEIIAATLKVAEMLTETGCAVTEGALPMDLDPLGAVWSRIAQIGLAHYLAKDAEVSATAAHKYREMAARGAAATGTELWEILETVRALRKAASALFADWDVILMPASAAMPWPAAEPFPPVIDGMPVGPRGHAIYTGWVNAAGLPGLSLPAPVPTGLPIGVQLIGDLGSEPMLLKLAETLEARDCVFRWPTVR